MRDLFALVSHILTMALICQGLQHQLDMKVLTDKLLKSTDRFDHLMERAAWHNEGRANAAFNIDQLRSQDNKELALGLYNMLHRVHNDSAWQVTVFNDLKWPRRHKLTHRWLRPYRIISWFTHDDVVSQQFVRHEEG